MHVASIDLAPVVSCAATARAFVVEALRSWDCGDDASRSEVELLTSEVVTNAYRHAWGPIGLTVMRPDTEPATVRVEVADGASRFPVVGEPGIGVEGGRGMRLVDRLSERWGAERRVDGKVVWFDIVLR